MFLLWNHETELKQKFYKQFLARRFQNYIWIDRIENEFLILNSIRKKD